MVQETDNNGSENQIARGQDNESDPEILQPASDSDVTTTNRDSHDSLEQASDVTKVENVESHDTQQHDVCHPSSNASPKAQETSASNATRATEGLADWGILAGVFLANTITGLNFTGFPVFYPYLVEHFEATNAAVAWCGSIHGFFQAFVSLFASYPIEVYGCRLPSVIGSLLFCVGMTLSCFAPDLNTIYITYGLIAGCTTTVTSTMIVHLMGVSSLPKCLAILQFASGFPRLLSPPLIGWVFDVTRDYSIAYSIIGCMAFVSGSLMVVLTFVTRCHQRKSVAKDSKSPS